MNILALTVGTDAPANLERECRAILAGNVSRFEAVVSISAALERIAEERFDVVLVEPVPGRDDVERLARAREFPFDIVVISAHPELAIRAFACGVLDFVPKPMARERLALALGRVRVPNAAVARSDRFIAVRRLGRIELIPLDDLLYVAGADKYSELVLANGRRNFHDQSLGRMEAVLAAAFVRIHKSYLVRFAMVARLRVFKGSRYFAEFKNGMRLPVGRTHYRQIKSRLI